MSLFKSQKRQKGVTSSGINFEYTEYDSSLIKGRDKVIYFDTSKSIKHDTIIIKNELDNLKTADFYIRQSRDTDECFQFFGITKKLITSNSEFDKFFHVLSDNNLICEAIKNYPSLQQKLLDLVSKHKEINPYIIFQNEEIIFEFSDFEVEERKEKLFKIAEEVIPVLIEIAKEFSFAIGQGSLKEKRLITFNVISKIALFLVILSLSLWVGASYFLERLIDKDLLFIDTARYSFGVFLLFICAIILVGRSCRSHILLGRLCIAFPFLCFGIKSLLLIINCYFGLGSITKYQVAVSSKKIENAENDKAEYYICLADFLKKGEICMQNHQIYAKTSVKDLVDVTVKQGHLGYKWIDEIKLLPKP